MFLPNYPLFFFSEHWTKLVKTLLAETYALFSFWLRTNFPWDVLVYNHPEPFTFVGIIITIIINAIGISLCFFLLLVLSAAVIRGVNKDAAIKICTTYWDNIPLACKGGGNLQRR